jgi:phage terminase small subunit
MLTPRPLAPARERFCQEYLVDLNAARAYRTAYPRASPKSARVNAARLLTDDRVIDRIQHLMAARATRVQLSADWVLERLKDNVERAMQTIPVLDAEGMPAGEYRYEGAVANRALELLGRHLGLFPKDAEPPTPPNPFGGLHLHLQARPWRAEGSDNMPGKIQALGVQPIGEGQP